MIRIVFFRTQLPWQFAFIAQLFRFRQRSFLPPISLIKRLALKYRKAISFSPRFLLGNSLRHRMGLATVVFGRSFSKIGTIENAGDGVPHRPVTVARARPLLDSRRKTRFVGARTATRPGSGPGTRGTGAVSAYASLVRPPYPSITRPGRSRSASLEGRLARGERSSGNGKWSSGTSRRARPEEAGWAGMSPAVRRLTHVNPATMSHTLTQLAGTGDVSYRGKRCRLCAMRRLAVVAAGSAEQPVFWRLLPASLPSLLDHSRFPVVVVAGPGRRCRGSRPENYLF